MLREGTSETLAFLLHSKILRNKKVIAKKLMIRPQKNALLGGSFFTNRVHAFKWLSLLGISLYCSNITITYSLNILLMVDRFLFSIQSEMRG